MNSTNMEKWKYIEGHEGRYKVSNLGNVKSLPKDRKAPYGGNYKTKERLLTPEVTKHGYNRVKLSNGKSGEYSRYLLHRLVAIHFIPNPNKKPCINHRDGNKSNNCVDNLQWVTHSENTQHGFDNGLINVPKGEKSYLSKLTRDDVIAIKKRLRRGDMVKSISEDYDVSRSNISMIKTGRSWSHINI